MKKILFVVGSLREGSFDQQFAQNAEKALEGKAEVSYLDWSQVPAFHKIWKLTHQLLCKLHVTLSWQLMLSGSSHQFITLRFLVQ